MRFDPYSFPSSQSADGGGAQGGIGAQKGDGYLEHWKESNAKAAEKDFQKDLEVSGVSTAGESYMYKQ